MNDTARDFIKRDDLRGLYPSQLNGRVAAAIGRATAELLQSHGHPSPAVVIGYDCRHGSREITRGFRIGLSAAGGQSACLGPVSTEHVYSACGADTPYEAGVMVTASHNPREYNGMKFVYRGCAPFPPEDLATIGRRAVKLLDEPVPAALDDGDDSLVRPDPAAAAILDNYAARLMAIAGLDGRTDCRKTPLTVVVLAGNGMGAVAYTPFARRLEPKGLRSIILEATPDGDFPQGVPNPLSPAFMARLAASVREHHADLGIGFDGDADRAGFVDATGKEIIPSHVLALIAAERLAHANAGRPVVMRNLCCSRLLAELFPADGPVQLIDTPVGHGRIKRLMRCDAFRERTVFAGEHSGHYFYPEFNYVDSGMLTCLSMLAIVWKMAENGEQLADRLADWRRRYAWSGEINFTMPSAAAVHSALRQLWLDTRAPDVRRHEVRLDEECGAWRVFPADEQDRYDPENATTPDLKMIRDNGDSGWWFVLRPSGNEPRLRLNVEAWGDQAANDCQALAARLIDSLQTCGATRG